MARYVVASGFSEACRRCGVSRLTSPWGWPVGLKGGAAEWFVASGFCIYLDCLGPRLFRAPCHGTRPHAGLRDYKKKKRKKKFG